MVVCGRGAIFRLPVLRSRIGVAGCMSVDREYDAAGVVFCNFDSEDTFF